MQQLTQNKFKKKTKKEIISFISLPFYDDICEVFETTKLVSNSSTFQANCFNFLLKLQNFEHVLKNNVNQDTNEKRYSKAILLRFCIYKPNCVQNDFFPKNLMVYVNNNKCNISNTRTNDKIEKEYNPIDITDLCKHSVNKNIINIYWDKHDKINYAVAVFIVRKSTPNNLFEKLKSIEEKNQESIQLIGNFFKQNKKSELSATNLIVSLNCPVNILSKKIFYQEIYFEKIGNTKIKNACRSKTCNHIQCFDAISYLQMNENMSNWICPICKKAALYKNLYIDGYFNNIIKEVPKVCNKVQINEDCSFTISENKNEELIGDKRKKKMRRIETMFIDSEEEDDIQESDKNVFTYNDLFTLNSTLVELSSSSDESIESLPSPILFENVID